MSSASRSRPCVTLFTDASFYHDTGRAGWGCVAIRDGRYEEASGTLKAPCLSSTEAELKAIANGLAFLEHGMLMGKPIVVLQSDSSEALGWLLAHNPAYRHSHSKTLLDAEIRSIANIPLRVHDILEVIKTIHDRHSLVLMLRHVKGHRRNDGRYRMNARADALARQGATNA